MELDYIKDLVTSVGVLYQGEIIDGKEYRNLLSRVDKIAKRR